MWYNVEIRLAGQAGSQEHHCPAMTESGAEARAIEHYRCKGQQIEVVAVRPLQKATVPAGWDHV